MTRFLHMTQKYAAGLLLAGALLLGGTKTPITFCTWAVAALGWSMFIVKTRVPDRRAMGYFLAFNAGVLLSQLYSLDPANSLFWTTQSVVFSCLWLALHSASPFPDEEPFWLTLQG